MIEATIGQLLLMGQASELGTVLLHVFVSFYFGKDNLCGLD